MFRANRSKPRNQCLLLLFWRGHKQPRSSCAERGLEDTNRFVMMPLTFGALFLHAVPLSPSRVFGPFKGDPGQGLGVLGVLASLSPDAMGMPGQCQPSGSYAGHTQQCQAGVCSQLCFCHVGAAFSLGSMNPLLQQFPGEHLAVVPAEGRVCCPPLTSPNISPF